MGWNSKNTVVKSVLHLENTAWATLNSKFSWNTSQLCTQVPGTFHKSTFFCGLQNLYLAATILKDCFPQASLKVEKQHMHLPCHPQGLQYPGGSTFLPRPGRNKGWLSWNGFQLRNCSAAWHCPATAKPFFSPCCGWIHLTGCFYPSNPWLKEIKPTDLDLDEVIKKKKSEVEL